MLLSKSSCLYRGGTGGSLIKPIKFMQSAPYSLRSTYPALLAHTVYSPPNPSKSDEFPPVLITHGLMGSRQNWNSIAKAMAKTIQRTVITFDARNHGDSPHTKDFNYELMADDILNLVQHLNIDEFTLMGHSMGGRAGMTFALKYPQMLDKLVVVDVSPLEVNADFHIMKVYLQALRQLQIKYQGSDKTLSEVRKTCELALRAVVIDPAVRAFLLTNLTSQNDKIHFKPNFKILLEKIDEIASFPQHLLKNTFDQPTLFIRGQKSLYIPISDFPLIKKTFTNAYLSTVENAGHWPHAENTVHFMEILLPFVDLREHSQINKT